MGVEKDIQDFLLGISRGRQIYFVGSTDKDSVSYHTGETMKFKIRPKSSEGYIDVPYVKYSADGEDGNSTEGFAQKAPDGWFTFETSVGRDGFVHVFAEACDNNKIPIVGIDKFDGGAGADIDKIKLGSKQPDDYWEFWDSLHRKVNSFEPELISSEKFESEEFPDFEFYDMKISVSPDMNAWFEISYPKNAKPGSLKLIMTFRGYGVYSLAPTAFDNCLCVHVNAHDIPNRESNEFYDNIRENELKFYGFDREENKRPETTYWAKMYLRNLQVARFVKSHPLLNGKDYIMFGGSQGGMQASNMAAHVGFATECIMTAPWCADLYGYEVYDRKRGWRPECDEGMRYFDTAVAAQNIKCPVMICAGLGDTVCPPSGETAMYNAVTAPKRIYYIQNQTHPYKPVEKITYMRGNVEKNENFDIIIKRYFGQ